jgi:hypothetical protein
MSTAGFAAHIPNKLLTLTIRFQRFARDPGLAMVNAS